VLADLGFVLIHVSLILMLAIFYIVMRMKGKKQIHYAFLALLGTLLIWALGAIILEYDHRFNKPTNVLIVNISYVGLILTPVAALFFGLVFANTKIKLSWKYGVFLIIPLISIILLFTNDYHHLFYNYVKYKELTHANALGKYFIIHTIYSYLCITACMAYLIYFSVKNAGFFSKQSIFIAIGIIISFGYNFLLTFQIVRGYFYTNVIAFFFSFLFFFLAIFKFDFLNVVPIALQNVVDHISDSFIVIDKDYYIIDYNKTFTDNFGNILKIKRKDNLTNLINIYKSTDKNISSLFNLLKKAVAERTIVSFEKNIKIGSFQKYFLIEITPIVTQGIYLGTIILLKDISQAKKDLETIQRNYEILMEQERLASLGQLIGGIAHNLNTPIMSLAGGIEALKDLAEEYDESIDDKSVTFEDHHEIAKEMLDWLLKMKPYCSYMSDVISTVKGQAVKLIDSTTIKFTLEELVKRIDILMKHELKKSHCVLNIDIKVDPYTEIKGEVNNLVQVFDNIIINAIHAYEGNGGVIDFTIVRNDDKIEFIINDYGKGIPQEVQDKLFKEMVTTKGKGGNGLGLYMSYSSIKGRFGGNMWFVSNEGKGTAFYISLPFIRNGAA